jgi:hypothetical protein
MTGTMPPTLIDSFTQANVIGTREDLHIIRESTNLPSLQYHFILEHRKGHLPVVAASEAKALNHMP